MTLESYELDLLRNRFIPVSYEIQPPEIRLAERVDPPYILGRPNQQAGQIRRDDGGWTK